MRVPMSWLRTLVEMPADVSALTVADRLTANGIRVEHVDEVGGDISGVVVARIETVEELSGFNKPIRWVSVNDGAGSRNVICGARNFAVGDTIAYARPPATLPGMTVTARKTYDHISDGMLCSARELGLGDDHSGIMLLDPALPLGADVVEALGLRDDVLELSINPDRGYALSVRGVAREVAIAFGWEYADPGLIDVPAATAHGWPVEIESVEGCDRYVARTVEGLSPTAESPGWMQRRLTLAGMRPLSLAVDITNYVMLEYGQPLHAFDRDLLEQPVVVRRARPGESLRTLDGVERELDPADLLIATPSRPLALAGVMGGEDSEISGSTTAVVIEAAHFDAVSIANTSRRHRLVSEASRRFERGVDEEVAAAAAERAVQLLVELGGAKDTGEVTDVGKRPTRPRIKLELSLAGRVAGVAYSEQTVRGRLADVGCEVAGGSNDLLDVTPPTWRPDLRLPADLVEEIARLEGYDNIPATVPVTPAGRGLTYRQRMSRAVADDLAAAGWLEVLNYPFVAADLADRFGLAADDPRTPSVRVANPVSDEEPFMRSTMLPGLMTSLARNVGRGIADLAIFELGSVFHGVGQSRHSMPQLQAGIRPTDDQLAALQECLPDQPVHIAGVACGSWEPTGWWGPGRPVCWADAIEAARRVGLRAGIAVSSRASQTAPWHPGRCAALMVGSRVIGHAGELHPDVVELWRLPARSCAFELDLESLLLEPEDPLPAPSVSSYPAATFDLALVVSETVAVGELTDLLRRSGGELLEALRLFDVYSGAGIEPGMVSYAFSARLRATDRTLTGEEVNAVAGKLVRAAEHEFGATRRS